MDGSNGQRTLSGDDLTTWAAFATVLEWLPPTLDAPLLREYGLTHFEYGVLYALADAPDDTLRMSALADYANSSLSRLSRAVSRLEARGVVRRAQDPTDRRSTLASLTEAGSQLLADATPVHEQTVGRLVLDTLTSTQKNQLRSISLRIQGAIRDENGWSPH